MRISRFPQVKFKTNPSSDKKGKCFCTCGLAGFATPPADAPAAAPAPAPAPPVVRPHPHPHPHPHSRAARPSPPRPCNFSLPCVGVRVARSVGRRTRGGAPTALASRGSASVDRRPHPPPPRLLLCLQPRLLLCLQAGKWPPHCLPHPTPPWMDSSTSTPLPTPLTPLSPVSRGRLRRLGAGAGVCARRTWGARRLPASTRSATKVRPSPPPRVLQLRVLPTTYGSFSFPRCGRVTRSEGP